MHDEAASWTLPSILPSVYFYWNKMTGVDKVKFLQNLILSNTICCMTYISLNLCYILNNYLSFLVATVKNYF